MKYLLVFFVVAVAIWLWRRNRQEEMNEPPRRPPTPPAGTPQAMLRCAHCGLHLPAADAIQGPDGVYCCAAHRQAGAKH